MDKQYKILRIGINDGVLLINDSSEILNYPNAEIFTIVRLRDGLNISLGSQCYFGNIVTCITENPCYDGGICLEMSEAGPVSFLWFKPYEDYINDLQNENVRSAQKIIDKPF